MKISVFVKNTVVLVATSLVLRSIGIFFRVWLSEKIGSEGMGLYQLIFSVYTFAATFATSGVSTAVTRLVADNEHKGEAAVKRIMRVATAVTLVAAMLSVAAVYLGARPIAVGLLKDSRAIPALKILSISLPFMGLSSCYRGYFIARRKTVQPSLVQVFEQAVRIAVVMACISMTAHKGLTYTAAAVLLGDSVAEAVSFFANWILYRRDVRKLSSGVEKARFFKEIMRIALPITGSSYLSSLLHTSENLLVPLKLTAFHGSKGRGLELFGAIRGMTLPILFFPASFLVSLSTMLMPEVSSASAMGDAVKVRNTVSKSVATTLVLSTLVACCFMFNADDIGWVVYKDRDVGQMILVLSPIVPFMYLESVCAGLLKGLDCQTNLLKFNLLDSVCRIPAVLFILPITGIKGYLGIMIISNCLTSGLSIRCLLKAADIRLEIGRWVLLPLAVGVCGGVLGRGLSFGLHNTTVRLVASLGVQVAVPILFYVIHKRLSREEKVR